MSHKQQLDFISEVKKHHPEYFNSTKVLEVGSYNVNGTIRIFFENCQYLGIDVGPGKDVDFVCQGEDLDSPDNTYDVTVTDAHNCTATVSATITSSSSLSLVTNATNIM